jgi:glycosyltransferase involved in cell wall biosynthesis
LAGTADCSIKVFYTWGQAQGKVHDKDFGIEREWDIDLLSGYDHVFVKNIATAPGSHHYNGIINPSLISEVKIFNPDKIIVYGWKFNSHLKLLRHFKGKILLYFRGDSTLLDEPAGFSLKKVLRKLLLQWVYRHVDYVLSPGTVSDVYFLNAGLSANQIIRAPHAVDNQRFTFAFLGNESYDEQAKLWRKKLGFINDDIVFLFAGKLQALKNPELLIKAFSRLRLKYKNVNLIMAGNGVLENELKSKYSLSIDSFKSLQFIPFQNQSRMPILYRVCNIFVLPSNSETWGLAINEAMACGRPVIVSDKCGAAADIVKNAENGFVFKAGDESELLSCMEKMILGDTRSMGAKAFETVQQFSYASFAAAIANEP